MRKIISSVLSILALVCILTMAIPGMASADAPTSVVVNWGGPGGWGSGTVTGTTTAGAAAIYSFATSGNQIAGAFNAVDSNDNPYGYNVDSSNSYINADVAGGFIAYEANRTGSYSGMYGPAGQTAASFVGSDGTGEMATGSSNNYAAMVNGTYGGTKTSEGYNYQASGTNYLIASYIGIGDAGITGMGTPTFTSTGNYALLQSYGSGTSKINDMTNQMGGTSLGFGWGGGCYTNANAIMTGAGTFTTFATGSNGINTDITGANGAYTGWSGTGTGTLGSVTHTETVTYSGTANVPNFSLTSW